MDVYCITWIRNELDNSVFIDYSRLQCLNSKVAHTEEILMRKDYEIGLAPEKLRLAAYAMRAIS